MPIERTAAERKLGVDRGKVWMADDFDAPLPADVSAGFLGAEGKRRMPKKK